MTQEEIIAEINHSVQESKELLKWTGSKAGTLDNVPRSEAHSVRITALTGLLATLHQIKQS